MDKINCLSWEGCAAPLCPLEPLSYAQWFPDEDICKSLIIEKPAWVKTQHKIKCLYLKGKMDNDCCFNLQMIEAIKSVRHPKGLPPEDLYRNGTDQNHQKPSISLLLPSE